MFISHARQWLALATAAAIGAAGLALSFEAPVSAETTHTRPGVSGVNKVFDWDAAMGRSRLQDTWQVYAKAGEVVHGTTEDSFLYPWGAPDESRANQPASPQLRVRVLGPDGTAIATCVASGLRASCEARGTAQRTGVHRVVWDSPNLAPGGAQVYFREDVWVTDGGTDKVGRVFTTRYTGEQVSTWQLYHPQEFKDAGRVDQLVNYVVGDDGTVFRVEMNQFDGISSTFHADSVGLFDAATCQPLNKSATSSGAYRPPAYRSQVYGDFGCGRSFLIFPDRPSQDLPERLTAADGWDGPVYPRYQIPETPRIESLTPIEPVELARPFAVTARLDLGDFKGTYEVGVDVDADGSLGGPRDVVESLLRLDPAGGVVEWRWDGRDALGAPVGPGGVTPRLKVRLVKGNEYHLILGDVEELRGGIRIQQLAGYQVELAGGEPVYPKVHWDDTDVERYSAAGVNPASTLTTEPKLVKTPAEGIEQAGPAHGWQYPAAGGSQSSWGDNSDISIDIWNDLTADADLTESRDLVARTLDLVSKTGELRPPVDGVRRIEYELTVRNTGAADFTADNPAEVVDTLPAHVTDWRVEETQFDSGTTSARTAVAGGKLTWSAALKAGETAVLRYSGAVEPGFSTTRVNTVASGDCPAPEVGATTITVSVCDDDPLVEEVGLPGLRVMKTADVEAVHRPGDLVRYAVTVTNVGAADFTARDPARVTDHLAGVADDALLDVSSIRPAGVSWDPDARTLSWSGPLKAGASQTISYEVAYSAAPGDRLLQNTAVIHPEDQVDATPGTKAETSTPGSDLHLTKTADVAETSPGGRVRYTVTLDNSLGRVAAPVDWTDDLTGVLDDAQLDSEPEVDGQGVRVQLDGDRITLGGTVGAGEKVLVRYSALVAEDGGAGDRVLRNALLGRCADGPCPPPEECRADDPLTTCTPVIAYSVAKEVVDWPGGAAPGEGDSVTYRLTFVNTGGAEAQVFQVDDLSGVLDDSDFAGVDLAGAGALSATLVGGSLVVRGPLALGARSVVEYRVMVRPAAERGDSVLHNLVSPSGEETLTPVADLEVVKSAVPSRARPGDVVTYTIALRALGTAGVPVSLVDTLTWVVDDAVVLEEPVSDNPAVTVEYAPGAGASSIEGWLEPGEAARIVYRVKVLEEAELGDLVMTNVVLGRGNLPFDGPARCEVLPKGSCTVTPVDLEREPAPKALPTTGAQGALGAGVLAAVLALAGLVVLGWSRLRLRRLA